MGGIHGSRPAGNALLCCWHKERQTLQFDSKNSGTTLPGHITLIFFVDIHWKAFGVTKTAIPFVESVKNTQLSGADHSGEATQAISASHPMTPRKCIDTAVALLSDEIKRLCRHQLYKLRKPGTIAARNLSSPTGSGRNWVTSPPVEGPQLRSEMEVNLPRGMLSNVLAYDPCYDGRRCRYGQDRSSLWLPLRIDLVQLPKSQEHLGTQR
jgi:hypothetical protein